MTTSSFITHCYPLDPPHAVVIIETWAGEDGAKRLDPLSRNVDDRVRLVGLDEFESGTCSSW